MGATSAKPLFRAMKARPTQPPGPSMFGDLPVHERPAQDDAGRADDFYPTGQPEAIRALLARDGDRIRQCGGVWEPACGDGALVREIRSAGIECYASDLIDRGLEGAVIRDFYSWPDSPARAIITNPPFCEINARDGHGRWLRHTLDMTGWDYLALLLSWDWPAARANGLGALLDNCPFSYCYLMRWKLDFTGAGSPPQRNAWFIWDRKWTGHEPAFRFLNREDGEALHQGSLL